MWDTWEKRSPGDRTSRLSCYGEKKFIAQYKRSRKSEKDLEMHLCAWQSEPRSPNRASSIFQHTETHNHNVLTSHFRSRPGQIMHLKYKNSQLSISCLTS